MLLAASGVGNCNNSTIPQFRRITIYMSYDYVYSNSIELRNCGNAKLGALPVLANTGT